MNRRGFLAALIAAPVVAKVAPLVQPAPFVGLAPKVTALPEPTWRPFYGGQRFVTSDGNETNVWLVCWGESTVRLVRR